MWCYFDRKSSSSKQAPDPIELFTLHLVCNKMCGFLDFSCLRWIAGKSLYSPIIIDLKLYSGFFCGHVSVNAHRSLYKSGENVLFFVLVVSLNCRLDHVLSVLFEAASMWGFKGYAYLCSRYWNGTHIGFTDLFCSSFLQSLLTVGSTMCNALDNIGTLTLNMYQSAFVVVCSSLQYSISRCLRLRCDEYQVTKVWA